MCRESAEPPPYLSLRVANAALEKRPVCHLGRRRLRRRLGEAASENGFLKRDQTIIIYNTGSGLKYLEACGARFGVEDAAESRLGGLVLPR